MRFAPATIGRRPVDPYDARWRSLRQPDAEFAQLLTFPLAFVAGTAVLVLWLVLAPFAPVSPRGSFSSSSCSRSLVPLHELTHAATLPRSAPRDARRSHSRFAGRGSRPNTMARCREARLRDDRWLMPVLRHLAAAGARRCPARARLHECRAAVADQRSRLERRSPRGDPRAGASPPGRPRPDRAAAKSLWQMPSQRASAWPATKRRVHRAEIRSADVGVHLRRYRTAANGADRDAPVAFRRWARDVPTDFGAGGTLALPSAKRCHGNGIDPNVSQADRRCAGHTIRARICHRGPRRSPGAPRNARHPRRHRGRTNPQAIVGKGGSANARSRRPRPPRHAGRAAALRAARQGRRADRRPAPSTSRCSTSSAGST